MDEFRESFIGWVKTRGLVFGLIAINAIAVGCRSLTPSTEPNSMFSRSVGAESPQVRFQDPDNGEGFAQEPPLPDLNSAANEPIAADPDRAKDLVSDVRIKGNASIPKHEIMRNIRTRPGRYFDPDLLRQDVEQLYKMKEVRHIVGPFIERTDQGIVVTIEVVEKPYVRKIRFVGNRAMTDWQLKRKLQLKEGQPLDKAEIQMARQQLEEYYREEGFRNTEITIANGTSTNDEEIVFVIHEDEKERVLWVEFEGNQFATDARLRTFVRAKPSMSNSLKGFAFDRNEVDQDVMRLTSYYRTFGFFNAQIGREIIESPDSSWVRVRFVINEGPRFVVNNVSFIGNQKYDANQLLSLLKLKPADGSTPQFNSTEMNADVTALRDLYGSEGHVFADVQVEPRFLDEPGKLDLVYKIEEGKQYRVGRINVHIDGDPGITKQQVILNRMTVQPTDIIDNRKIRQCERQLRGSQVFADGSPGSGAPPRVVVKPDELKDLERYADNGAGYQ